MFFILIVIGCKSGSLIFDSKQKTLDKILEIDRTNQDNFGSTKKDVNKLIENSNIAYNLDSALFVENILEHRLLLISDNTYARVKGENYLIYLFKYHQNSLVFRNQIKTVECNYQKYPEDSSKYSQFIPIFQLIKKNDQKFRSKRNGNMVKQAVLDQYNRVLVDSLFNEIGFPSIEEFGFEFYNTYWVVLHHSSDCDWNLRWITKFLESYVNCPFDINSLNKTFDRLYIKENSICSLSLVELLDHLDNKKSSKVLFDFLLEKNW